jgi:hypothetical protein
VDRLVGGDSSRVPEIAAVGIQSIHIARDKNLVCRLKLPPLFRFNSPIQPWPLDVNAQRIDPVLAAKIAWNEIIAHGAMSSGMCNT